MNIVFFHPRMPDQFLWLAQTLGQNPENQVIFLTGSSPKGKSIPHVKIQWYDTAPKDPSPLDPFSDILTRGTAMVQALFELGKSTRPDLILGPAGSGTNAYIRDLWPDTPFLAFFDWTLGPMAPSDARNHWQDITTRMTLRTRQMPLLMDLFTCDQGICPTAWHKNNLPPGFHEKIRVAHEGVDTDFFFPAPLPLPDLNLPDLILEKDCEIISFTTHILAPYPGFSTLLAALPQVLEKRPHAHVVMTGTDHHLFGKTPSNPKSLRQLAMETPGLQSKRIHFLDPLSKEQYRQLLQCSALHISLDFPFILPKSLLEAMACGCLVLGVDRDPVTHVIQEGINGFAFDFSSKKTLALKILSCLEYPSFMVSLRKKARQTICGKYDLAKCRSTQLRLIHKFLSQKPKDTLFG
jgi:glycosyltransferase involved in cell wall biosynthesis